VLFLSMRRASKANELYKLIERRKADGRAVDEERAAPPFATEAQKESTDSPSKS
jgi:hypothetical protein